jgi:hypothetical protein
VYPDSSRPDGKPESDENAFANTRRIARRGCLGAKQKEWAKAKAKPEPKQSQSKAEKSKHYLPSPSPFAGTPVLVPTYLQLHPGIHAVQRIVHTVTAFEMR